MILVLFFNRHLVPYLTVEEQLTVIAKEAGVNKKPFQMLNIY